jgi:hypothetical protein
MHTYAARTVVSDNVEGLLLVISGTLATVKALAASPTMSLSPKGLQDYFDHVERLLLSRIDTY